MHLRRFPVKKWGRLKTIRFYCGRNSSKSDFLKTWAGETERLNRHRRVVKDIILTIGGWISTGRGRFFYPEEGGCYILGTYS